MLSVLTFHTSTTSMSTHLSPVKLIPVGIAGPLRGGLKGPKGGPPQRSPARREAAGRRFAAPLCAFRLKGGALRALRFMKRSVGRAWRGASAALNCRIDV